MKHSIIKLLAFMGFAIMSEGKPVDGDKIDEVIWKKLNYIEG